MTTPYEAHRLAREILYGVLNRCPLEGQVEDCHTCMIRDQAQSLRDQWKLDSRTVDFVDLARKYRECMERNMGQAKTA